MKRKIAAISICLAFALAFAVPALHVDASAHVARIIEHQSLTGQTADLAPAFTVTAPSSGADYRVTLYGDQTSGPTNEPTSVIIDYTDDVGAIQDAAGLNPFGQRVFILHSAPSTTVSVSVINSQNVAPGSTYNLYVTIEEL